MPSATVPHVSHYLFCSCAYSAQLTAAMLASGEQHRKATHLWALKKYEGHQPSRNKPDSATGSPDQRRENPLADTGNHIIIFHDFLHLRVFFSCLTSECKSGQ